MVEDEARDVALVEHALREGGMDFAVKRVETQEEFLAQIERFRPAVILSDHGLPAFDGFTALALAQQEAPGVPFIFVTGSLGEEMTVKMLKGGASDFVLKHQLASLPEVVRQALRQAEFQRRREAAGEALQSSEGGYRNLVELSPDALMIESGRKIEFMNAAGLKLFGATAPEQMAGRPLGDLIPDEAWQLLQGRRQPKEPGQPGPFVELRLRRLDGRPVDVEVAAAPMVFAGRAATQIIAHDISERKRAEEKRVEARTFEIEAANKELEAFSYSVSHDLRAPLRHIEGFIEIILSTKAGEFDDETRRLLDTVADSAKQMGRLIDDLLAFSRTARAELKKTRFDLTQLARSVIRDLQQEARARAVEWVINDLPAVVADPALLRQVLVNLLGNALKYTRPRKVARIEIGCRPDPAEDILYVADNGVGFDMRYAHKLFGVFQRLHRAADFEGTGIGLANVRRIVLRHGGRVWAEGRPDQGATFFFSLPRDGARSA